VDYTYEVLGATYRSDRIEFGGLQISTDRENAMTVRAGYPEGARVPVFYDPKHPERAVLRRDVTTMRIVVTVFMIPFVLVGVWLLWRTGCLGISLFSPSGDGVGI
jgi:hypothetical protein